MTAATVAGNAAMADLEGGKTLAALELQYFKAVSLYRRRNYEKCTEVCNTVLQAGHDHNVQMFAKSPGDGADDDEQGDEQANSKYSSKLQRIAPRRHRFNVPAQPEGSATSADAQAIVPTWLMEGVWQLKMRALTMRVYIDDLETNDAENELHEEVEFERIATTARPGTSIKNAFVPRPRTSTLRRTDAGGSAMQQRNNTLASTRSSDGRLLNARPSSGILRPGSSVSRPGSSTAVGARPASRCGTASRVRATSAAAFTRGDSTAKLYQASRLNPTVYAEREVLVKALFEFLFYHEADVQKAYSLCEAVLEVHKQKQNKIMPGAHIAKEVDWWWQQQIGRCLLYLHYPRKAETYLRQSLTVCAHPDTYLLLSRLYQRLKQPERSLEFINSAVDRNPFDVTYRIEQARLFDVLNKPNESLQMYRLITKINPINTEALACIALSYFYDNNPEMALMYYRRILSLGLHMPELYCNIALCCLYGGQIDLVLPCFQRSLATATTAEQKSDIWYNLSFVGITTGDFHLAQRCLKLCLNFDAHNGAALNNLAVLTAHSGDILNAKSYLNAAKEIQQDSNEVKSNLDYLHTHYKL